MLLILFFLTFLMMTVGRYSGRISLLSLVFYLSSISYIFYFFPEGSTLILANGLLRIDSSLLFSLLFMGAVLFVIVSRANNLGWEFHLMLFGGYTGAIYMILGYDWLISLIGFEFLNLSTYLILSLYRGTESATLKYLLMSAFFTTLLLLSISLFYGLTGSTAFDSLYASMNYLDDSLTLWPQLLLLLTLSFKLGLVPVHLWVPDVYDGLPMELVLWIGTLPKLAILFFLPVLHPLLINVNQYFLLGGVLSFLLAAISLGAQYRLKRFLAFSAIGHMGIMITGFAIGDYHSFWFYTLIYFVASVNLFLILAELPGIDLMKRLSIITNNYPLAFAFMVALLTMAAVPPFSGFYAKLLVLFGLIDVRYMVVATLLILTSLRTAAYYLRLLQTTFFGPFVASLGASELRVSYATLIAFTTTCLLPTTQLLLL
uniref:NADH-ubiquinone oxidoreductase chain 2 n=1 Tax=Harpochytrium sp. JEL94 TaxID=109764 RepID=Q85JC4_9FUNG|nr:NADH dehydrogenase subunit 2 [Harpochytrium sp. JEL94]AAO62889.1 NADH dehydrogenase subunit 2 [Harpochytrium sp. JEL94]